MKKQHFSGFLYGLGILSILVGVWFHFNLDNAIITVPISIVLILVGLKIEGILN